MSSGRVARSGPCGLTGASDRVVVTDAVCDSCEEKTEFTSLHIDPRCRVFVLICLVPVHYACSFHICNVVVGHGAREASDESESH